MPVAAVAKSTSESAHKTAAVRSLRTPKPAVAPTRAAVIRMQQTFGNRAVAGMLLRLLVHSGSASPSLVLQRRADRVKVNEPGDVYEQEADRIAEAVMAKGSIPPLRQAPPVAQRKCAECESEEEQEKLLRRKARVPSSGDDTGLSVPPVVHEVLKSPGQQLDQATRAYFEPRFGHDFSRVRVHTGPLAEQSAQDVNAHAYTFGNNIVFGAGRFVPKDREGGRLLAHELTHVVQQGGGPVAVQRQPGAPDPSAERAVAVAELEAVASVTREQLEAQSDAEDALKLNWRKRRDKNYAWSLGRKDRDRLQERFKKSFELSPALQQEITVKLRFFRDKAKAAYIQTISPALTNFPSEQVTEIIAPFSGPGESGGPGAEGLGAMDVPCDIAQEQYLLQYEGEPGKSRCIDKRTDPEFANEYFDKNIKSAVGYAAGGTTWENVEYDRFKVMLVNYRNGSSEYIVLDEIGNFYRGDPVPITLNYTYLKRKNGLIYPVYRNRIYFKELLTPNIIELKNGLKFQIKELKDLYTLLQVAGRHALIMGLYGAAGEGGSFKTSIQAFRRTPATLPGKPLPGIGIQRPKKGGIPEPIPEEAPTGRIPGREPTGEIVGGYRVVGTKTLKGTTFERNISGLFEKHGRPRTDIRPIKELFNNFIEEAKAAGATELKITGEFVRNPNVIRMQGIVKLYGGNVVQRTPITPGELGRIEIIIPVR